MATFEAKGREAGEAIDGDFGDENGWGVEGGELSEQTAIFTASSPLDAGELQVQISCVAVSPRSYPTRFEVSVTKDISPKLEGQWTPLRPSKVLSVDAETFESGATFDQSVVTLPSKATKATVALRAPAPFPGITGFRLTLIPAVTVSRATSRNWNRTGGCTIQEFEVKADPQRSTNVALGRTPFASGPLDEGLPAGYITDGFPGTSSHPRPGRKSGGDFYFDLDLGRSWPLHHIVLQGMGVSGMTAELREEQEGEVLWRREETPAGSSSGQVGGARISLRGEDGAGTPFAGRWLRLRSKDGAVMGTPDIAELEVYPSLTPIVLGWAVDGKPVSREELPARSKWLHFEISVPSSVDVVRSLRYRLPGWQEEWRVTDATKGIILTTPPAGHYRMEIQALHTDGVWDASGAPFEFTLPAVWWKTGTFIASAVFVAGLLMLLGWRQVSIFRLRRGLDAMRHEQERESYRQRIARDMHDDIGARLTHLAYLAETMNQESGDHSSVIAREARDTVASLDQIVWAVNPRNDSVGGFADYVSNHASRYLGAVGIRLRQDVEIRSPEAPVGFEPRHGLMMACKEALGNIVKHSGAKEATLRITDERHRLAITISDNGKGFSMKGLPQDRNGISNMEERLAELGGTCQIESFPGEGTQIAFSLPLDDHH